MKTIPVLALVLSMLALPVTAAQLYRWVDEKGNVEWRDTPPPPTARKVEQRNITTSTIETSELPYSLQQAVKNFPVTLWVTDCGDACAKARAHLDRRGVPYSEMNPQSDIAAFKKASGGDMQVPLLFVGSNRLKGYLESEWDAALDTAGYPKTALAPTKPRPKAPKEPVSELPAVKLYTNAQCGPQCVEAKELLGSRGIKFQEVSVEDGPAIDELKKLSGDTFVPTLAAGRFIVRGFDAANYHHALDQSGYRRDQQAAQQ
jgi:glutaredoxin